MEPITTAIIVGFLADKVLGTATEKYTESAIAKLNQLTRAVWERLRAKNPKAEKAIAVFEQQDLSVRQKLETYLDDEMQDDPEFRAFVETLAQEIEAGKKQVQGGITQQVGQGKAVAIQSQNSGGKTHNAETITIHYNTPAD
ncbi:MAG: hypothetical protein ACPGVO_13360 [Spirulinaceae cyanobacterium]